MSSDFLKDWLHRKELSQAEKLLILLSTFEGPTPLKDLLSRAEAAGLKRKHWANASASLSRLTGFAIHTVLGWEITASGRQRLASQGIMASNQGTINLAADIRGHISAVTDEDIRQYLTETVRCYELGLLRSAVVMAWVAAIYILQMHILNHHLAAFNDEAARLDNRWKVAKSTDDIGRMKEADFLDRIVSVGVIGKNVKAALKECLDRRNACGHPNSYKIGPNIVSAHIETLILNVFSKF